MTRARGPRHRVPFRRRREKKTDFYLRRRLVLSGKPRLVVRPSSRHMVAQIIEAHPESDATVASSHSSELGSYGWKGSTGNLPAAYLTGLLLALRAKSRGIEGAIFDVGVKKTLAGSRVYAALKGTLEGGLAVSHEENVLPSNNRIRGEHIASYGVLLMNSDEDTYRKCFSRLLSQEARPETLPELFESTRSQIIGSFGKESGV